jgi:diamine N-acetyltransferase
MQNGPTPDAVVTLEEITADNLRAVMRLEVKPDQEDFVAPNSVSIAEYCYADEAWMRAIYAGGEPVGFVLLSERRAVPRYYLWRYMIDGRYQGRGFGARAMQLVIDYVRTLPNATEMYVNYVPAPGGPRDFYAALGFVDTGVDHDGELEMKLVLE